MQRDLPFVIVKTAVEGNVSCRFRQDPPLKAREGHKMSLEVALQMWQIASIESHVYSR
ncbi:MAG TPA: hypothetical protein VKW78_10045 [Terriglobales bacterium]|nr:hypothetical protein [Terriglobales bacterium]